VDDSGVGYAYLTTEGNVIEKGYIKKDTLNFKDVFISILDSTSGMVSFIEECSYYYKDFTYNGTFDFSLFSGAFFLEGWDPSSGIL